MWRFLFIALSTAIYVYIYFYLHRHFKRIWFIGSQSHLTSKHETANLRVKESVVMNPFSGCAQSAASAESQDRLKSPDLPNRGVMVARSFTYQESYVQHNQTSPPMPKPVPNRNLAATEAHIKKTLLLNAYPIMYIILWIPGIANRVAEATGHPSRTLAILQASTQYIGLANAITYGLNERIVGQLRKRGWHGGSDTQ